MSFRNISMCFEINWVSNVHWTIQGKCKQIRGYITFCAILYGINMVGGLHIFVLAIHKLQNTKDKKP